MDNNSRAVGVFDSGLGGLTSVRELKRLLPDEKIIYFGDTGRVPYGTRSPEIITKYALDDMSFLSSFGVKAVLIACGTVSSVALEALQKHFSIPIMGVVSSAAKKACALTKTKRIAMLATPATVRNKAYEREAAKIDSTVSLMGIGCPMFVPLVENGYVGSDCEVTRMITDEYISKLSDFSPDVIILGCTHFPIIRDIIADSARRILGEGISIVDSGAEAAISVKSFLERNSMLNHDAHIAGTEFYVSDETHNFEQSASLFLGENIKSVTKIDIGDYMFAKNVTL